MARTKGAKDSKPRKPRKPRTKEGGAKKEAKAPKAAAAPANGKTTAAEAPAPKEAKAEKPERGIGDNSGLTSDQKRALLVQGIVKLETLMGKMESVKGDIRNLRKQMKSDGFEKYEVDFALQLRKSEDDVEQEKWRRMLQVAEFLNHPIGTQPDLFGPPPATAQRARDHAYQEGKLAGLEAKGPLKPDYAPGTADYDDYCRGWHDGQAELVRAKLKDNGGLIPANQPGAQPTLSRDEAFTEAVTGADVEGADGDEPLPREEWAKQTREQIRAGDETAAQAEAALAGNAGTRPAAVSGGAADDLSLPPDLDRRSNGLGAQEAQEALEQPAAQDA